VAPPVIILVEPTTDGTTAHEHVDLIYFCRPVGTLDALLVGGDPTIRWVSREELERNQPVAPMPGLAAAAIPEDVRLLALSAIRQEAGISS